MESAYLAHISMIKPLICDLKWYNECKQIIILTVNSDTVNHRCY